MKTFSVISERVRDCYVRLTRRTRQFASRVQRMLGQSRPWSFHERLTALEASLAAQSSQSAADVTESSYQLSQLERRLDEWSGRTFSAGLFFGHGTPSADRVLTPDRFERLAKEVANASGADIAVARQSLQAAYRLVLVAEAISIGRIAGSTVNILGKVVTTRLLIPPSLRVLEIGTLYGVFAGVLAGELARGGDLVDLTVLDPLEGVQLQTGAKTVTDITGTPVTESVVRRNLQIAAGSLSELRILRGYSTDDAQRERAADRTYGIVVVDGDHSAKGVEADLEWVETIIEANGVVVVDDYGDPRWTGVKEATDRFLQRSRRLRLAGVVATSAFLVADSD